MAGGVDKLIHCQQTGVSVSDPGDLHKRWSQDWFIQNVIKTLKLSWYLLSLWLSFERFEKFPSFIYFEERVWNGVERTILTEWLLMFLMTQPRMAFLPTRAVTLIEED